MRKLVLVCIVLLSVCCAMPFRTSLRIQIERMAPWQQDAVYSLGAYCQEYGEVYQSLQDGNLDHEPVVSPEWWEVEF